MQISKTSGTRALPFRGRSGSETKAILKAKLEKTQAALEVDRQLVQQVNELIGESPSIVTKLTTSLMLPPELSELISTYTKLYKTSEAEAVRRFDMYVQSLHDEHVVIEDLMQEIEILLHVGGERMESAFSLTSLTGNDGGGGLLMKTHAEKGYSLGLLSAMNTCAFHTQYF